MRVSTVLSSFLLLFCLVVPTFAEELEKPENIAGKMAYKFTSGVTNIATSVVELPKQSILSARDEGAVGYVIGPLKGVGMTFYRAFIGTFETLFFYIPQPGYYEASIDPDFVWNGWGKPGYDHENAGEVMSSDPLDDDKGE